jgi:hypothetical protein
MKVKVYSVGYVIVMKYTVIPICNILLSMFVQ